MTKITISNEFLNVTINSLGAEVESVKKLGKEMLWEGNPDIWAGHSPILFPICGGLKDDKFIFEGIEYSLLKHGFAKRLEWEVESAEKEKAVFLLASSEETLKVYPFKFELRAIFTIEKTTLKVEYEVKNLSDTDMYYSIGAHEAYACPGGIENYTIEFEKQEDLKSLSLEGPLLEGSKFSVKEKTNELKLSKDLFTVDSLIFDDLNSRKVWLKNNITNEKIEIEFEDFGYMLLWTIPGAEYICIEPWCGIPDFADTTGDITKKEGILKIPAKEALVKVHSMLF